MQIQVSNKKADAVERRESAMLNMACGIISCGILGGDEAGPEVKMEPCLDAIRPPTKVPADPKGVIDFTITLQESIKVMSHTSPPIMSVCPPLLTSALSI